jgi:hypothetical protein
LLQLKKEKSGLKTIQHTFHPRQSSISRLSGDLSILAVISDFTPIDPGQRGYNCPELPKAPFLVNPPS